MSTPIAEITLKHWGNSLAVRIPAAVVSALQLKENSRLSLTLEAGRVVMEPNRAVVDVDALIGQITLRNRHAEADFGKRVGKEAW